MKNLYYWTVTQSGGALRIAGYTSTDEAEVVVRNVHRIGFEVTWWGGLRRYAYARDGRQLARLR